MTIQDWGAIGEVVGGIGVLLTLVYLAFQIRQNTKAMNASATQAAAAAGRDVTSLVMSTPGLADVLIKIRSGEELDAKEAFLRNAWSHNSLRGTEAYYLNWKAGLLSNSLWESRLEGLRFALAMVSPEWWESSKAQFESEFAKIVTETLQESKPGEA